MAAIPKRSEMPQKHKSGAGKWTDGLDPEAVQEALEEATVDAYGEYEQHTGVLTMIQDQVEFPFRAMVLGEEVNVVDMEWPEDDEFGVDLMCERGGKRHGVEVRSVDLVPPLLEGHLVHRRLPGVETYVVG
jgi:hypothetical protein